MAPALDLLRSLLPLPGREAPAAESELVTAAPDEGDDWGLAASEHLAAMEERERAAWMALLVHVRTASGARPAKPWLRRAREEVAALGERLFKETAIAWLDLLGRSSRRETYRDAVSGDVKPTAVLAETNAAVLKGLVWCCGSFDDAELARALGRAAEACYRKVPDVGPRSAKVGNACVWALGAMPGLEAVGQLQRVQARAKYTQAQRLIEGALAAAAARAGLSAEELEELAAPTCGLEHGPIRREIGDYSVEIEIAGVHAVEPRWRGPDGRPLNGPPASLKASHRDELAALRRTIEDLRRSLPAQRDRIERLFLAERAWTFAAWRERYLDHPLVSLIARRLIWSFQEGDRAARGAWVHGRIVGVDDHPLDWTGPGTTVRLWHPIEGAPEEVLAWREWLERHAVTQPFKQAHREVYLLTDAERATATYSNRFAAHLLRQHQLKALCEGRGWRMRLQGGGFDAGRAMPRRVLAAHGLEAELWIEVVEGRESEMGIALHVATDQVRFRRPRDWDPVRLDEVPPLAFSEVMRDVDLFVGVASVGNDPTWRDRGPENQRGYWERYAWGDLSQSARTRRDVLARLLPRLTKLAGRWELTDRFLVVRGELRSYKIHLGSGNILMSPNDQYLCIVPGRGPADAQVFLPFEGDTVLPLILSKALMLAEDDKIRDPTITRQIAPRA